MPFPKSQRLKWNQPLVVIHGQDRIKFLLLVAGKKSICAVRAKDQHIVLGIFDGWFDNVFFFPSDQPFITGMGI